MFSKIYVYRFNRPFPVPKLNSANALKATVLSPVSLKTCSDWAGAPHFPAVDGEALFISTRDISL